MHSSPNETMCCIADQWGDWCPRWPPLPPGVPLSDGAACDPVPSGSPAVIRGALLSRSPSQIPPRYPQRTGRAALVFINYRCLLRLGVSTRRDAQRSCHFATDAFLALRHRHDSYLDALLYITSPYATARKRCQLKTLHFPLFHSDKLKYSSFRNETALD